VSVASGLARSGPTQGAANVITIVPEIELAVTVCVPVPENEHAARPVRAPTATVKVACDSCAPETVPVIVALTSEPPPWSNTTGPETLEPVCVAIQDLIGMVSVGLAALRMVPDQVPERLRAGVGAGMGAGVGAGAGAGVGAGADVVGGGLVAVVVGAVGALVLLPQAIISVQATIGKERFMGVVNFPLITSDREKTMVIIA
jgi:hypothetical protein